MPRIAPVTGKCDVPAEHHAVVDEVLKVFGTIRGPFSILLHSPKLAERAITRLPSRSLRKSSGRKNGSTKSRPNEVRPYGPPTTSPVSGSDTRTASGR